LNKIWWNFLGSTRNNLADSHTEASSNLNTISGALYAICTFLVSLSELLRLQSSIAVMMCSEDFQNLHSV